MPTWIQRLKKNPINKKGERKLSKMSPSASQSAGKMALSQSIQEVSLPPSDEEVRYLHNQQRLQEARDNRKPLGKEKHYISVLEGPNRKIKVDDIDAARKIHSASPIHDTTYDHIRPAKTAAESGICVTPGRLGSWIDKMDQQYEYLRDGSYDHKEAGFLDELGCEDISSRKKNTKRKLFGEELSAKESKAEGAPVEVAKAPCKRRKLDDSDIPFRDHKAYEKMRRAMPTRVKDKARIEADIWLERFRDIPQGNAEVLYSLEQMNISDNNSPPTLSEGSAASPPEELFGHYDERRDNAVDPRGSKGTWALMDCLGLEGEMHDEDWRIRSRNDPIKGFVREKVWVKASQWDWS